MSTATLKREGKKERVKLAPKKSKGNKKPREKVSSMSLSERALCVSLHISKPGFSKHDKQVSEEVIENHKAGADAGRYTKILISREALKEINSIANAAKKAHYAHTLPWEDSGTRIITNRAYGEYSKLMLELGRNYETAVANFLKGYPEYVKEAKIRLGTMYNDEDFRPVGELKDKFSLEVEPKPVPTSDDFRAKVSNESAKAIAEDIERRTNERLEKAMTDVWERVQESVSKVIERLQAFDDTQNNDALVEKHKGAFRDSLIENVREIAQLLPMLNINDDPELNKVQSRLIEELCAHTPDELRKDSKLRKQTRKSAKDILRKVNDYMM